MTHPSEGLLASDAERFVPPDPGVSTWPVRHDAGMVTFATGAGG